MMKTLNIRKGSEEDIARIGQFYDDVVLWLNDHVNYPRWIYKVYPSESSVRDMVNSLLRQIHTMVNFIMIRHLDSVYIITKMKQCILDIGKMI